jgi:hypothetical protein
MTNPTTHRSIGAVALAVVATIALAACSGASQGQQAPPSAPSGQTAPSAPPAASTDPGSSAGGGGSAGDPGSGIITNPSTDPGAIDPIAGEPRIVTPVPGRANPHPVAPVKLEAQVDGRRVLVKVSWYGGIEPCSVLDSVKVTRSGNDIQITPFEGASDPNAICIEIAVLKATIVDLGEPDPGTWRILSPDSDAPPVQVTID